MAAKRCIPTSFFKDPDIASLGKDAQLILIGLALIGDDEGRGIAQPSLLGREIDYPPEQIEAALTALAERELIVLYQVGRHRYYQIAEDWQKSMGARRTPSKLPPPETSALPPETSALPPETSALPPETSALPPETSSQYNLIKVNSIEDEEKGNPSNGGSVISLNDMRVKTTTAQVAAILRLPVSPALTRVIADFLPDPTISLTGEADMAREYIDTPTRNRKRKGMTPAFYRQWLKREQDQGKAKTPTGTDGKSGASPPTTSTGLAGRSLMGLEATYQGRPKTPREPASSTNAPPDRETGGAHGEQP